MTVMLVITLGAVTALAHAVSGDRRPGERPDLRAEDGIEIAQGLALAAFGIFATIAIFAVLEAMGINLVQALFNQLMP
jgi:hypothetical protein